MRPPELARYAASAIVGLIGPYVWVELVALWGTHVYTPITKLAWSVFALRGPIVFWMNYMVESILFGAMFGLILWSLGSAKVARLLTLFAIAFVGAFFGPALTTSTADELRALVSIGVPSVVLLLVATAGTCWLLPRRRELVGA